MELIHHIMRTRHSIEVIDLFRLKISVKYKKLSGLLKSTRCSLTSRDQSNSRILRCMNSSHRANPSWGIIVIRGQAGNENLASRLVEPIGIEPMTFALQTRRSPS